VLGDPAVRAAEVWAAEVVPALKPLVRAIFSVPRVVGARDGALVLGAPNEAHRSKCAQYLPEVEAALAAAVGAKVKVVLVVDGSVGGGEHDRDDAGDPGEPQGDDRGPSTRAPAPASRRSDVAQVVELHPGGAPTPDEEIDLDDLVDAPPESVVTPIERLAQAFPGSELMDERR